MKKTSSKRTFMGNTKLWMGLPVSLAASLSFAGPISSGGGMAVVCQESVSAKSSVELLDLYEARLIPKLTVLKATGDLLEDYTRLTNRSLILQGATYAFPPEESKKNLRHMMSLIDWSDAPEGLPFLNDQGRSPALPSGCKLQQLAIFFDSTDRIKIDRRLWEQMDTLNQAALLKHESYYYFERRNKETTSESTRSYVRQEAATGFEPNRNGVNSNMSKCYAFDGSGSNPQALTMFYIQGIEKSSLEEDALLQIEMIANRKLYVKATAVFKGLVFDVRESVNSSGETILMPSSSTANKIERTKIETDHRNDWELEITFVANKAIEVALLQNGIEISKLPLRMCK